MNADQDRTVNISGSDRSGRIEYREPGGEMSFYWELGGGDAIAIVQTGTLEAWKTQYPWAVGRRAEILRFVAAEAVRQKAPGARAEVDDKTGDIVLRQVSPPRKAPAPPDVAWYYRLRNLRLKFALGVLAAALVLGGLTWIMDNVFVIDPGKGTPVGLAVRTDTHIATLIQALEAYTPSPNRDHSRDRYTISVFVVPLDGTAPRLVPLGKGLPPNQFVLAKILGSDGRALWVDVGEVKTVDLESFAVRAADGPVPGNLQGALSTPFTPDPVSFLSAGFLTAPDEWLGLHSTVDLNGEFQLRKFVRRVVPAQSRKEMRRFYRGTLEPDSSGKYFRILAMSALGDAEYFNAAFLRLDDRSEPIRFTEPPGALMLYTSDPGLKGAAMLARVGLDGSIAWTIDSGIDRFNLTQILPAMESTALVGTRPREEGKVPEPLLAIVDHATGSMTTYSLWQ